MPEAIKVTVVLEDYGELYRLFPMPRFEVSAGDDTERQPSTPNGRDGGNNDQDTGDGRGKSLRSDDS